MFGKQQNQHCKPKHWNLKPVIIITIVIVIIVIIIINTFIPLSLPMIIITALIGCLLNVQNS